MPVADFLGWLNEQHPEVTGGNGRPAIDSAGNFAAGLAAGLAGLWMTDTE